MRIDWTDDGHRLQLYLSSTTGLQLEVLCPHGGAVPPDAPCCWGTALPEGKRRCIIQSEVGELGASEILWDCFKYDLNALKGARLDVSGPIDIEWRGRWDEDDVEFWWRAKGMGVSQQPQTT